MKKFISYFLIFTLFVTVMPVQIFAQDLNYKPAMSFEYDYYEMGQVKPEDFVANLERDLLNFEDYVDPEDLAPKPESANEFGVYGNKWGSPAHLREVYNKFLYYNVYPEESPLWNKTALVPGDGVSKDQVLAILDHHHSISETISYLLKENPKYKRARIEKHVRLIPSYLVQLALFWIIWEEAIPEVLGAVATYISASRAVRFISTIALMGVDMWITDEAAYEMQKLDKRLDELFQSVGMYKSAAIEVSANTDLLKPITETEAEQIKQHLEKIANSNSEEFDRKDIKLIRKYLKKGYAGLSISDRDKLKIVLGRFLYDMFEGDKILIDKYVRKEMLRTYYALLFIEDELFNESDPLRYERAIIDLATTYKIQNIQINDNRIFAKNNQSEVKSFGESLQDIKSVEYGLPHLEPVEPKPPVPRAVSLTSPSIKFG